MNSSGCVITIAGGRSPSEIEKNIYTYRRSSFKEREIMNDGVEK
jgi:hypothetical protein